HLGALALREGAPGGGAPGGPRVPARLRTGSVEQTGRALQDPPGRAPRGFMGRRTAEPPPMDEQRLCGAELAVGERLHRPEGRGLRLVTQEMDRVIRGARVLILLVRRGAQARRLEEIEHRRSELIVYL